MEDKEVRVLLEEAFKQGCEWREQKLTREEVARVTGTGLRFPYRVTYFTYPDSSYKKRVEVIVECGSKTEAKKIVQNIENLPEGTSLRIESESATLFD